MTNISLAPLQGFTDHIFRQAFHKYFGGIDAYYTPFIRTENDKSIKNAKLKDVLPENNSNLPVIPQLLVNSASDFIQISSIFENFGYKEINWNLGCPYPMVAKHQLGSGLLPYPELINQILSEVLPKIKVEISIKMRLGYENSDEIDEVLEVLNKFPIKEIIIHPRIGKQMYKGTVNLNAFENCISQSKHKIAYNGDIDTIETFNEISSRFPNVNHFMIGRALISNPFLAEQIKGIEHNEKKIKVFEAFHNELYEKYASTLSGSTHLQNKMLFFWEYFADSFSNSKKVFKRVKKANNIDNFNAAIMENFRNEDWMK
ncbi:MAG: tRNA-dihydrouridine synthase family protein [Bacteroidota bacterium]